MSQVERASEVLDPDDGHVSQGDVSQTPFPPRFPQEIFDNIIDYIDDEVDGRLHGLRTCSLVSRGWASSTAYHLFYRLHWPLCCHSHHRIPIQHELVMSQICPYKIDGHGPAVLQALLANAPRVYNNVRDLRVEFPNVFPPWPRNPQPGARMRFIATLTKTTLPELLSLVDLLPQLRLLKLSNARVQEYDSRLLGFLTTIRRTRTLSVLRIDPGDEHDPDYSAFNMEAITHFLRCFTDIRVLRFSNIQKDRNGLYPQLFTRVQDSSTLRVQTLVFHGCYPDGISHALAALQNYLDFSALTALELRVSVRRNKGTDPVFDRVLSAFLRLSANLEVLTCEEYFYRYLRHFVPSTLRELHLRGKDLEIGGRSWSFAQYQSSWAALCNAPAQFFTPTLRAIHVHVNVVYNPLSEHARRMSPGDPEALHAAFKTELQDVLAGCDWAPFVDVAQSVETCTLHMRFGQRLVHFPDEPGKRRCMDAMERIARGCMQESMRGAVRIEVVEMERED